MTNESVGIVLSADLDVSRSLKGVEKQEGGVVDKCDDKGRLLQCCSIAEFTIP